MNTYIPTYIGTVSKSDYDTVRKLITPILKKYLVGLKGRGRGSRKAGEKTVFLKWLGTHFKTNPFHQSIPLKHSTLVGLYIRVEPTKQFLDRYKKYYHNSNTSVTWNFESMTCPLIRDEIRKVLSDNNITVIRT